MFIMSMLSFIFFTIFLSLIITWLHYSISVVLHTIYPHCNSNIKVNIDLNPYRKVLIILRFGHLYLLCTVEASQEQVGSWQIDMWLFQWVGNETGLFLCPCHQTKHQEHLIAGGHVCSNGFLPGSLANRVHMCHLMTHPEITSRRNSPVSSGKQVIASTFVSGYNSLI